MLKANYLQDFSLSLRANERKNFELEKPKFLNE
jgi:hypothetical protein